MEAYTDFASVYDVFMDDTPYSEWADFLEILIKKHGISAPSRANSDVGAKEDLHACKKEEILKAERDLVLDLGCGTGTLTELLYQKGYDMIGVDNSEDMLNIALAKRERTGSEILYLCQDMRNLDLYSTIGTVICVCDSINYLLEDDEVEDTFALVNNYLYPGGIFVFDFNTVYKYEKVIGDTTIAENRETCSFIWENYYHEEGRINEYDLTIFAKAGEGDLFRRFTETHFQRGYTLSEMTAFVEKAGMKVIQILDADTHESPNECSERIYVVARECKKNRDDESEK